MTLVDTREELLAKSAKLDRIFDAAKGDDGSFDFMKVKDEGLEGDQKGRVEAVQALMAEINDLGAQADEFRSVEAAAAQAKAIQEQYGAKRSTSQIVHPTAGDRFEAKSIGELFTSSKGYQDHRGRRGEIEIDLAKDAGGGDMFTGLKTLMSTSAGWGPEAVRTGKMVESAQRPVQVLDFIPSETTNQTSVVYMEETTFTNNAAEVSEGGTYGEAALALTERTSPVRKIAVWLPVTDEQLEDEAGVQSYINNRLGFMVRQRLDGQILVGDGVAPNLEGIQNRSGIQTQAKGADTTLDAIRKARSKVRKTGRALPNTLFIETDDLDEIAMTKTADGIYILANPNTDAGLERIWGLRVVETNALTAGTGIVGDTMFTGLAMKKNLTMKVTDSHSTYFIEGKQAIRCELRCALQVYRPAAFCKVTGI